MGVTFKVEGLRYNLENLEQVMDEHLLIDLAQRNARPLAKLIGIPLESVDGLVGELGAGDMPLLLENIEKAMMLDFSNLVIPDSIEHTFRVASKEDNVVHVQPTIRWVDFGMDEQYIMERLLDFYMLISKALEQGKGIEWC